MSETPPSEIQDFLERNERQPGEKVLGVTAYGRSSTLIVTNQRIIGKTQDRGSHVFRGTIQYPDVLQVHYTAGLPVFGAPSLQIEYRAADGNPAWVTFHFTGGVFANLLYRLADYDPSEIYRLFQEQVDNVKKSDPSK